MSFLNLSNIFGSRDPEEPKVKLLSFEEITSEWDINGLNNYYYETLKDSCPFWYDKYNTLYSVKINHILNLYLSHFTYIHVDGVNPKKYYNESPELKELFVIPCKREDWIDNSSYKDQKMPIRVNMLPGKYLVDLVSSVNLKKMSFRDLQAGGIYLYDDPIMEEAFNSFSWFIKAKFELFFRKNIGKIDGAHYLAFLNDIIACIAHKNIDQFKKYIDETANDTELVLKHVRKVKSKRDLYLKTPEFLVENDDVVLDEASFLLFLTHNSISKLRKVCLNVYPSLRYENAKCEKDVYGYKMLLRSLNKSNQDLLTRDLVETIDPTIFYYENLYDNDMIPLVKCLNFTVKKPSEVNWAAPKEGFKSMSPYRNFMFLGDAFEMPYFYEDRVYKLENELYSTALLKLIVYVKEKLGMSEILILGNRLNLGTVNKILESLKYYKDKGDIEDFLHDKVLNIINRSLVQK